MKLQPVQLFIGLLGLFLFASCSESKIPEGEVQYELTYPYMETEGLLGAILPDEMTIIFKGTKMKTTIKKGRFFETNIISDEANEYLVMYSSMDNQQLYCELTKDEINNLLASQPKYECKKTSESDSVAGVFCHRYTVASNDSIVPFDAWFTEGFEVQKGAWFSAYAAVVGFPLVYDIQRYGILTHAEAVSFTEKEITDADFKIEGEYKKVNFEEYESESKKLFDILVEW